MDGLPRWRVLAIFVTIVIVSAISLWGYSSLTTSDPNLVRLRSEYTRVGREPSASGQIIGNCQEYCSAEPPAVEKSNLYLGYAVGYNSSHIQRFVNNAQRYCGKTCDIVLFVKENMSPMTFEYPQNVYLITRTDNDIRSRHIIRYLVVDNWLKENSRSYQKVIFSDIRDVIIQTNPFDQITSNAVYAFEEKFHIATEPYNKVWLKACYGEAYVAKFVQRDAKCVCCGVIMGTLAEMKAYFNEMVREINWQKDNNDDCFRNFGIDTSVTYKVLMDVLPNMSTKVVLVPEGEGYSSHELREGFKRDSIGRVLNNHGKPYALLHHADRTDTDLFRVFEAMYPYRHPE
jgi:hypothetical protein